MFVGFMCLYHCDGLMVGQMHCKMITHKYTYHVHDMVIYGCVWWHGIGSGYDENRLLEPRLTRQHDPTLAIHRTMCDGTFWAVHKRAGICEFLQKIQILIFLLMALLD